jgi:galactitol PTS system EIIC component
MQWLLDVLNWISGLGAPVMLPILIFILAEVFGAKPGKAFRAALMIGVAFVGINLVIGLLGGALGPAAQAMVTRTGVQLNIIDVGWPAAAAIAFGGTVGIWIIPIALIVNIIMLVIGATKTLDVDIWNFWHFAFTGGLVYVATQDLWLSIAVAALNNAIVLFLADWTAPGVQALYNLPGISIPHGFSAAYVPLAIPLNALIDVIPGLNKLQADPDTIKKNLGVVGEPLVMGVIIGLVIGCLAYLGVGSVGSLGKQIQVILNLAIDLGAVMVLLPRMVSILMEGLIPVSQAAGEFMQKHFSGREVYIGLDSAILVGHPSAIAIGLLMAPITIALAIGMAALGLNRVLPFTDLAVLPFMVVMVNPITRGNIVRGVIIATVLVILGLMIGTAISPLMTQSAIDAKFTMPTGATQISSICDGMNPLTWLLVMLSQMGGVLGWILTGVGFVVLGVIIFFYKKNAHAWEVLAGAPETEVKPVVPSATKA